MVFRGKAQCAGNGCSLVKHCNAAAEHHRDARRVGLSASMAALMEYIPVFHPFGGASRSQSPPGVLALLMQRATAIRCEGRLALNADRPTES